MELTVSLDVVCRLIVRAQELEAKVPPIQEDDADDTSSTDESDDPLAPLEEGEDDTVEIEIRAALDDLADDELAEILALAWVGRGTYDASEWEEALEEASDPDGEDPIEQLMDMPMLAGLLDAGLAAFDLSCEGVGQID